MKLSRKVAVTAKPGLLAGVLLCLLLTCSRSLFASDAILIVKSSDNRFFNTTIEHLIDNSRDELEFKIQSLNKVKATEPAFGQFRLIVTLGYEAAEYLSELETGKPVIHSYLTEFQHKSHKPHDQHYSVLLDQPLARYIKFIKLLLDANHVGIVKPSNDPIEKSRLDKLQKEMSINLNQVIFNDGDNAVNTVRTLLRTNDVLLTLPAPTVYNRQSLKGILLATYRLKKPVISYSPAHVKSGALAAIFSSPENIGKQLADLLNRFLNDKNFKPRSFYYPNEFDISINHRVAKSLNLDLPDKKGLLKSLRQEGGQ